MKTKFYKKLVPIALIASMAITNVGMTSASAAEVGKTFSEIVTAVDVGEGLADQTEVCSGIEAVSVTTGQNFSVTDNDTVNLKLEDVAENKYYPLSADSANNAVYYKITDSDNNAVSWISVGTLQDNDADETNGSTEPKYALLALNITTKPTSQTELKLKGAKSVSKGKTTWADLGTFTIAPKPAETTPAQDDPVVQVAAGDVFQIPAGLAYTKAKGSNPEVLKGYKVGVAKIVATPTAPATVGENEVDWATIKQTTGTDDNTLGTWDGTEATKPTPANSSDTFIGKNVLYYENEKGVKTFVRILSDTETAKLPKAYKTATTLTGTASSEGKAYTAGDDATLEKKALNDKIKTALSSYLFGTGQVTYNTPNAYFTSSADLAETAAVAAKKITDTETVQPGQVALSAIPAVKKENTLVALYLAATDATKAEATVVGQLIEAYNKTDAGTAKAFLDDTTLYTAATENTAASITGDGLTALANILAADPAKYLKDDAQFQAVVKRTTEAYLNELNEEIYLHGAGDPAGLQWTLETLEGDSETVVKSGKETTVYTKDNANAKFYAATKEEIIKKTYDKKAKAYVDVTKGLADKSVVARVKGATATIVSTKSNKKFNNVVVLKAVTDDYVTPSSSNKDSQAANVVLTEKFYVTPALPTIFTPSTLTKKVDNKGGVTFDKAATFKDTANEENYEYDLSVDVSKGYKLPFGLKDGQEKDLVYEVTEASKGFTVIGGKVTGVAASTGGAVKVYPRVYGSYAAAPATARAKVNVTVKAFAKSVVANTKSISVYPGCKQEVSLGTNPASAPGAFTYKITNPDTTNLEIKAQKITYDGEGGTTWEEVPLTSEGALPAGTNVIVVSVKAGGDATKVTKNSKIKAELYDGTTSLNKKVEITVNPATAPADITGVKATVKGKEITTAADGTKVINIPVGGSFNTGWSVSPAAANTRMQTVVFDWDTENNEALLTNKVANISGDVITGLEEGTAYITIGSNGGIISDSFKSSVANKNGKVDYFVNVYDPGSTITLPATHVLRGGILMEAGNAASECKKEVTVGKAITMTAPTAGTTEPITWSSNNPAGCGVKVSDGNLVITPVTPGKYNITGTTKFTKQSIKFSVNVGANEKTADEIGEASGKTLTITNATGAAASTMKIGEKLNAFMASGLAGAGGKVTFTVTNGTGEATINNKGVLTAKKAGTVKVNASMDCIGGKKIEITSADITIAPKDIEFTKVTVPASAAVNTDIKVSASFKNADKNATVKWEMSSATNTTFKEIEGKTGKSATLKIDTADTYYIRCKIGEKTSAYQTIKVYDKALNSISTAYTFKTEVASNADKTTKDAAKAADKKNNDAYKAVFTKMNSSKENEGAGYGTYYVPLFAKTKDGTVLTYNQMGGITWTSDNKSLATAETVSKNVVESSAGNNEEGVIKAAAKKASAAAMITVKEGYTGKVTLTGTTWNGGKKVKINLYVVAGQRVIVNPTEPTEVTSDTPATTEQPEVEIIEHFGAKTVNFGGAAGLPTINGAVYPENGEGYSKDDTYITNYVLGLTTNKDKPDASNSSNFDKIKNFQSSGASAGKADIDKTVEVTTGTTYYLVAKTTYKEFDGTAWSDEKTGYVVVGTKGFKAKNVETTSVTLADSTPVPVNLADGKTYNSSGTYTVVQAVDKTSAVTGNITCQAVNGETGKIALVRHQSLNANEELKVGYIKHSTDGIVAGPFYFSES